MTGYAPPPGTIGLCRIPGPAGWAIATGQLLLGYPSRYSHAYIVTGPDTCVEAHSRTGVRETTLTAERIAASGFIHLPLTDWERDDVVTAARAMVGASYSWAAYAGIALVRLRIRPRRLLGYIDSSNHTMCSMAVDRIYLNAAKKAERLGFPAERFHLFTDGRPAGQVTPGDLATLPLEPHPRWDMS